MITQWQQGVLSNPQALFAAELMRFELLLNPQGIALDRLWPSWAHNDPTLITIASRRARCLSGPGAAEALGGYLFPTAGATAPNDLAASAELLRTFLLRGADGPAARLANELVKDPRTFGDQSRQGVGAVTAVTLEVARRSNDAAYLRSMLACVAAQDNYFFEADQVEGTIDFIFNFVRQPHADMRKVLDSLTAAPNTKHALVLAIALSGEKSGDISGNAALAQSRQRILAHVAGTDPEQSVSRLAVLGLLVGGSADDKLAGLGQAVLDAQERAVGQMFLNALSGVQKIIAPHCSDIGSVTADKPEPSAAEVASNVWLLFVLPQEACAASLGDMAKIVGNRFVQVEEPSQVLNGSYLMLPPRYLERLVRAAGKELQELSVN
jgi:hypothetical protein